MTNVTYKKMYIINLVSCSCDQIPSNITKNIMMAEKAKILT